MRFAACRRTWIAGLLATCLSGAGTASAVTLPVEWDLVLQFGNRVAIEVSGTGTAIANGSGGPGALQSLSLPAGMIVATGLVNPITDPAAAPIYGFVLTAGNGAGAFTFGTSGPIGGAMPLLGILKACLFANCDAAVANLTVPLSPVGVGGAQILEGAVNVTVTGAPWTTGTAMATGLPTLTYTGYAQGPTSAPSSTAQVGGSMQLVTPFSMRTSVSPIPTAGYAFLTLRFVPEPASALLVMSGIVALARFGRARR